MNNMTFETVPPEILVKIFRFLNLRDLRNAIFACKRWKDIIEYSCRWSLKLSYRNPADVEPRLKFALTDNRKFGKIEIEATDLSDKKIYKLFKKHGQNVETLILRHCSIHTDKNSLKVMDKIFGKIAKVKNIKIELGNLNYESGEPLERCPEFKELKHLEMFMSDFRMVEYFRKAELRTIRVAERNQLKQEDAIVEFVSKQKSLKSLTLKSGRISKCLLAQMGKKIEASPNSIKFTLTHLAIATHIIATRSTHHDDYMRFVNSQANSLTQLEMGFGTPFGVYECAFARMPNLQTVTVAINHILRHNIFYDRLEDNYSVRTIRLTMEFNVEENGGIRFLRKFLNKFPNAQHLIIQERSVCVPNAVFEMSQSAPKKIQSLSVSTIGSDSLDEDGSFQCEFPELKTLYIQSLDVDLNWKKFAEIHPSLRELTIETIKNEKIFQSDDIDQITSSVDVQILRLGTGFIADDRFIEIVRTRCPNLEKLELHRSCISEELMERTEIDVLQVCSEMENDEFAPKLIGEYFVSV